MWSRRHFLAAGGVLGAEVALARSRVSEVGRRQQSPVFRHGVASGDPLADRVVLWTRVSPEQPGEVPVRWRLCSDPHCRLPLAEGTLRTGPERDFTLKVDVTGLVAGTTYYYCFESLEQVSPIGRTRTLPEGDVERLRLAVVSCANYASGFFNVYARIAERRDLDLVVHLGDYLYEHRDGDYGDGRAINRTVEPPWELVSLADYRWRHAFYRQDPDLQALHREHPMICVWDDHEIADNAWQRGAGNHQPLREGSWAPRREAAVRAYLEWMPLREQGVPLQARIYRNFAVGNLLDLVMLDTRLVGRERPMQGEASPSNGLLGDAQMAWCMDTLSLSRQRGVRWRLIGQQVMFSQRRHPRLDGSINSDAWDGYAGNRYHLLDFLRQQDIRNTVILSGDAHSSWAAHVAPDPFATSPEEREALAVELVCPAVSSPPPVADEAVGDALAAAFRTANPHLAWVDLVRRGYLLLEVTPERLQASWCSPETVLRRSRKERLMQTLYVESGSPRLMAGAMPG